MTAYGPDAPDALHRYPCLGGCGAWLPHSTTCLGCWLPQQTYSPEQVRWLGKDDPRRARVRDDRDRRRERPSFGRVR